jgi:hypothetical protein
VIYIFGTVAREVNPEGIKEYMRFWKEYCSITELQCGKREFIYYRYSGNETT